MVNNKRTHNSNSTTTAAPSPAQPGPRSKTMKMKNGNASSNSTSATDDEVLEVNLISAQCDLGDFTEFLDTGQLADIVLRCSDGRFIDCHRLVLAARARNLRHFCGPNFLVTELVFRNCVKFEHLQALVNLLYRGHITGKEHQITSTLWKLFKIFGVRVAAKCFRTNAKSGQRELAHELKYMGDEDVEKGAAKFEKIVHEFRSETRRRRRRNDPQRGENGTATTGKTGTGVAAATTTTGASSRNSGSGKQRVIVISDDDEQGVWSSASCTSSVSSLSSSSSDGERPKSPSPINVMMRRGTSGGGVGVGAGAMLESLENIQPTVSGKERG